MKTFKGIILGLIIAVLVVFAFLNSTYITVKLAGDKISFDSPLWAVVYVSFILGMVFGFLLRWKTQKPKNAVVIQQKPPKTEKTDNAPKQ